MYSSICLEQHRFDTKLYLSTCSAALLLQAMLQNKKEVGIANVSNADREVINFDGIT